MCFLLITYDYKRRREIMVTFFKKIDEIGEVEKKYFLAH